MIGDFELSQVRKKSFLPIVKKSSIRQLDL